MELDDTEFGKIKLFLVESAGHYFSQNHVVSNTKPLVKPFILVEIEDEKPAKRRPKSKLFYVDPKHETRYI